MSFEQTVAKLEHLITRKQNAKLIKALRRIKHMVDTSKGSESLTCLALQDYVAVVLRDAGGNAQQSGKTDAGDANAT